MYAVCLIRLVLDKVVHEHFASLRHFSESHRRHESPRFQSILKGGHAGIVRRHRVRCRLGSPGRYFGTVKTASRVFPKLKVDINVPTKYRRWPLVATSLQPKPVVIRPFFPVRGAFGTFLPL
jgi:hypothetical protein